MGELGGPRIFAKNGKLIYDIARAATDVYEVKVSDEGLKVLL